MQVNFKPFQTLYSSSKSNVNAQKTALNKESGDKVSFGAVLYCYPKEIQKSKLKFLGPLNKLFKNKTATKIFEKDLKEIIEKPENCGQVCSYIKRNIPYSPRRYQIMNSAIQKAENEYANGKLSKISPELYLLKDYWEKNNNIPVNKRFKTKYTFDFELDESSPHKFKSKLIENN